MTTKATIEPKAPAMVAVEILAPGAIHGEKLIEAGRRELPAAVAEKLISRGDARPMPRLRHVALANLVLPPHCYDRGEVFYREEPVPPDYRGMVLELAEGEPVPDPLPEPSDDQRMWMDGPLVLCEVLAAGVDQIQSTPVGGTLYLRERIGLDFAYFDKVRIKGHLSETGRLYQTAVERSGQRPSYERIARERRRQPVPPDPKGAREMLRTRALRPCEAGGAFRHADERFSAPAWTLAEPWVKGWIEPLDRPSVRFLNFCDRLKEFLADPNATYPIY
jgi:hypothetical protein